MPISIVKRTTWLALVLSIFVAQMPGLKGGEPTTYSKDEVTDLYLKELQKAQLYIRAQTQVLETVKALHPQLGVKADEALNAFELSEYGVGFRNIDSIVISTLRNEPAGISSYRNQGGEAEKQLAKYLKEQPPADPQKAASIVDTIAQRAKGVFSPESVGQALIAANPKFQGEPELEMAAGFKRRVSTAGHEKSKGRSISFDIPKSWAKLEGNGKNVIMVCRSNLGTGDLDLNILLAEIDLPGSMPGKAGGTGSKRAISQFEHEEALKSYDAEIRAPDGWVGIRKDIVKINESKWCLFVSEPEPTSKFGALNIRTFQFTTLHNRNAVVVTFHIRAQSGTNLQSLELKYQSLFISILRTLKFDDEDKLPRFGDLPYAIYTKTVPFNLGKKTAALEVPAGLACIDRSADLMADYVKAHFKDLMKGTQMLTFGDADKLGDNASISLLALDTKLEPKDIPERLVETEKILNNKARVVELTKRSNASLAKAGHYSPEEVALLASRATGEFAATILQKDTRHFLLKVEGENFTNFVATMACESRMLMLNSQGTKDTALQREKQIKSLIAQLSVSFSGSDPDYKMPARSKTVASESGSFTYVLPITWDTQVAPGIAEKMAAYMLHGYKGQVCSMIFIERRLAGSSVDKVLAADMAELSTSYSQKLDFTNLQKGLKTANGLPYSEASLLTKSSGPAGDVLQTLYVLNLKDDLFLSVIFSTKPDRHKVFSQNARELLDSIKSTER